LNKRKQFFFEKKNQKTFVPGSLKDCLASRAGESAGVVLPSTGAEWPLGHEHRSTGKPRQMTGSAAFQTDLVGATGIEPVTPAV
jgi:hypothetical protein